AGLVVEDCLKLFVDSIDHERVETERFPGFTRVQLCDCHAGNPSEYLFQLFDDTVRKWIRACTHARDCLSLSVRRARVRRVESVLRLRFLVARQPVGLPLEGTGG